MWFEHMANSNKLILETGKYAGVPGKAVFDLCGTHRYFLEKRWAQGGDILTAFLMNPSNAAHNQTDDTVNQLINLAKIKYCDALYVVNVSSIIGGTSSKLKLAHLAYELLNWNFIFEALMNANFIFLGWGLKGQLGLLKQQKSNPNIVNALSNVLNKTYCYDVLKSSDKKYASNPIYYVPHPRPLFAKEKYRDKPLQQLKHYEFAKLFNR
ncbi:DUF1643 domain-containing protein [Paenibacillus lautus]|uniref:DUF1643 domain-containing protein n=1 Tax=Paenibacillus lautus TaxID=1401 RepID=UPI003850AC1B